MDRVEAKLSEYGDLKIVADMCSEGSGVDGLCVAAPGWGRQNIKSEQINRGFPE